MNPIDSRMSALDLPEPSAEACEASLKLVDMLRDEITGEGPMPFDRYMEAVLYTPGLGYYSGGSRKFGAEGDFVTSPEISPVFAQCLARQCAQVFEQTGTAAILEFGAGSGILAVDLMTELQQLGHLPERYLILELSAELRDRQQSLIAERLPELIGRVEWLTELPTSFSGVVIANEVLDAMPVSRFRISAGQVQEQFVSFQGERLTLEWGTSKTPGLTDAVTQLPIDQGSEDYQSEINLRAHPWLEALAEAVETGLVLLIDYGYGRAEYYHPQRQRGTLICHYRHRAHDDPLVYPGLQDITANVDFTAVAEAGLSAGFNLAGYTSQAFFLMGCGLDQIVSAADPESLDYIDLVQGVKRLTLPTEMGERFKVMGLSKGIQLPLVGFALREQREKL